MIKYFGKSLVFAAIVVMSSCGDKANNQESNEEGNSEVKEASFVLPQLTGIEYKMVVADLSEKGISAMNDETGDANFDVYCFGDEDVVEDCVNHLSEKNVSKELTVETVEVDGVVRHYAYQMKK